MKDKWVSIIRVKCATGREMVVGVKEIPYEFDNNINMEKEAKKLLDAIKGNFCDPFEKALKYYIEEDLR